MSGGIDFFISYTRSDERWAEWVGFELEAAGYTTKSMAWDFHAGSNFALEMQNATAMAERTLAIISPAYLRSDFCKSEWAAAFATDPTGSKRRLVPVRVAECQPDGLLAQIIWVDLVGLEGETAAREKLLIGVSTHRTKPTTKPNFPGCAASAPMPRPAKPAFPGALPPVWTVPHPRNPFITGRGDLLDEMHRLLNAQGRGLPVPPLVIHGLGGTGKTQLVVEYAFRNRSDYDTVLWCGADSEQTLASNLAALSRPLTLPEICENKENALQAKVMQVIDWLLTNRRWLLILDNADTTEAVNAILDTLPSSLAGQVLITARWSNWPPVVQTKEVEQLANEVAAEFLQKRVAKLGNSAGTREEALTLACELGGLPLALEQAAAYLEHCRITFRDYLARLRRNRPELLKHVARGTTRYPTSVADTWVVSEGALGPLSRALLRLVAFLAPENIPRALFAKVGDVVREALRMLDGAADISADDEALAYAVDDALVKLADYSLIRLTPTFFDCHRLLQATVEDRLSPDDRQIWRKLSLKRIAVFTPKGDVIILPNGSNSVDFAYTVHTDIGNRTVAGKINYELFPLRTKLRNGDHVEIITASHAKPNPIWLRYVATRKARYNIRHVMKTMQYHESSQFGERMLNQTLSALGAGPVQTNGSLWDKLVNDSGVKSRDEILADIGLGKRLAVVVACRLLALSEPVPYDGRNPRTVVINGSEGTGVQFAKCCRPIAGDPIIGAMKKLQGLVIHRHDCPAIRKSLISEPQKWVNVEWGPRS